MDVIVGRRHFVHAPTLAGPGRVVGVVETRDEYWNHNTAYHPWLVDIATRPTTATCSMSVAATACSRNGCRP